MPRSEQTERYQKPCTRRHSFVTYAHHYRRVIAQLVRVLDSTWHATVLQLGIIAW